MKHWMDLVAYEKGKEKVNYFKCKKCGRVIGLGKTIYFVVNKGDRKAHKND